MLRRSSAPSSALAFLFILLSIAPVTRAQVQNADAANPSTPNTNPVLIELFTSEGCSSCPPADIVLQRLDTFQPIAGAQLIVLSEHVTYWDHDGWKDPNSSPALTDRQTSYESVLGEKEVFTPQMIVDGTQQLRLGDSHDKIEDLLKKAAATPKVSVRIGNVTIDPGNPTILRAHVEADANLEKHAGDVFVAVALDHVESQVLKGENGGKHLVHVAVVQQLTKVGKLPKGKSFAQDVQLKLTPGTDPKNVRLIALVQESGPGKVLGAALKKPAI
jgi:hypothetical protein